MWRPYLVTVSTVLLIGLLKVGLNHLLKVDSPLLLFFTAIALSAWYGGAFHGFLATLLTITAAYNYFIPLATPQEAHIWAFRILFFLLDASMITIVCARLRNSHRKAHEAYRDLKNVELSLRKSEGRLRKIFESNMIGLVYSNFQGQLLQSNDYFLNLLKASRADLQKGLLNWIHFTPPEFLDMSHHSLETLKANGFVAPFEKEYVRTDGVRVSVMVGASRVDEDSMVAFILDISDRRSAERALAEINNHLENSIATRTQQLTGANEELSRLVKSSEVASEVLRESQSFLDSVVENIPNMIFVKSAKDLRFVRFNKAGEQLVGHSREELVGKNDYDIFPKEEADFFTQKDRAVLEAKAIVDIPEESISTPSGVRYLHTKKIPVMSASGEPQYLLGISEDITERKQAETQRIELLQAQAARHEAEKSVERLAFLSEASNALNKSLNIHTMLNLFAEVLVKNMASWCFVDFYDDSERSTERIVTATSDASQAKKLKNWHMKKTIDLEDQDGIGYALHFSKSKIYNEPSDHFLEKTLSNTGIASDILSKNIRSVMIVPLLQQGKAFGALTFVAKNSTQRYDDLDLSIAQDLARRAASSIENAKLYSKANEASRAKSAFLANISHEIRTPLGAMLGFAELCLDGQDGQPLSPEQNHYISTIVRNGRQLLKIVDEVLDLSKVESDRIQIEKIPFALKKLIEDVISLLRLKADEKGLDLQLNWSSSIPSKILSDPLRIRQVLLNIIGNAIKFTEKGYIDVSVQFQKSETSSQAGFLQFVVLDSGIGISPDQNSRLFEPFMQADDSMTRKFGGTGLGLFLSRKLARLMNGDVLLEKSTLGLGSQFKVTLQVEIVKEHDGPVEESPRSKETSNNMTLQPHEIEDKPTSRSRVLVVDDSPDNQFLVKAFLSKINLTSDSAENGLVAVQKALRQSYDIILMDIQMPEMDGFEAVQRLRHEGYQGIVIALTAHAMKGDRERCLNNGFDDYLCKPLNKDALFDCIKQYIPALSSAHSTQ